MNIQSIPEHELARLREKAKEVAGSRDDYSSFYTELLTRRLNGEPLQYIEEYIPFYSIQVNVDSRALIPRPETEFLIQIIKENIKSPKSFLDIGTGSGCIALMLKKLFPESSVDAVDISEAALELAVENANINGLEVNFYTSDLLSNIEKTDFDCIVANLPYIPSKQLEKLDSEVIDHEPLVALDGGGDGLLYISRLIDQIEQKEIADMMLFLEIDDTHGKALLDRLINWSEVRVEKDLAERDRYIVARR